MSDQNTVKYRHDYRPPEFLIPCVEMLFDLDPEATKVSATLFFKRNHETETPSRTLTLDGENQTLLEVLLDGKPLKPSRYRLSDTRLIIDDIGDDGTLTITTRHAPANNTALEGLYISSGVFCTQCEAEGFRRITYFPDRPDVLSRFKVTIRANEKTAPILLANGNLCDAGALPDGRHFAVWEDPFPKPCYLFALVAGDLDVLRDHFTTCSGRRVTLEIYSTPANIPRCRYAMDALKRAMRWDENRYRREYDLERFMIFCADDFNMGAMENKGLNIFNSALILADPETATDDNYHAIESVIAHEYFHNWTGNRVTCRDWFQLSLKEGLTVFRDQQFSADTGSAASERIAVVDFLRRRQFPEDAGPMAHPVRPDEYREINNFYTMTIYEKGAEVIRMQHTLLGEVAFQRGMDLYFKRHDGQAVTCDDFVQAMQDASGTDLTQFKRWYEQAGTPIVRARGDLDANTQSYTLTLEQYTPPTPGQTEKKPLMIPVAFALLDTQGAHVPLKLKDGDGSAPESRMLILQKDRQTFCFQPIPADVTPSLLRGGSAPVKLAYRYHDEELRRIAQYDSDPVNRWDAMQRCLIAELVTLAQAWKNNDPLRLSKHFLTLYSALLDDENSDPMFRTLALTCPDLDSLVDDYAPFDCAAFVAARRHLLKSLADELQDFFRKVLARQIEYLADQLYAPTNEQAARRRLAAHALFSCCANGDRSALKLAANIYRSANNMTDVIAALTALRDNDGMFRQETYADFERRWRSTPLVLDKWFAMEATRDSANVLTRVQRLTEHPAFTLRNPNRVRALLGSFALRNFPAFHDEDGGGYRFIAHYIDALDASNPHSAAMLLNAFRSWRKFSLPQRDNAYMVLQDLRQKPRSPEISELLDKLLAI
ncbi:MAG: aminopeptidase N [Burkholderiales bacterium]|jgi:aminopeptidase N|nr:aminopeptidase N [Burkholderiales bacterium]